MDRLKSVKKLAKLLFYVLGRRPDEFGLIPDINGYVKIKELLKALNEKKELPHVNLAHINEICTTIFPAGIEISDKLIRAEDRTNLPAAVIAENLPKLLFLCVKKKAYHHINEKGISVPINQMCILYAEKDAAVKMGKRYDQNPIFLTVYTNELKKNNIETMVYGDLFYTTCHIPNTCFRGPVLLKEKKNFKKDRQEKQIGKNEKFITEQLEDIKNISPKSRKKSTGSSWKNNKKRIRKEKEKIWPI